MAYTPVKTLDEAYALIKDEGRHMEDLAKIRDMIHEGSWQKMESRMRQQMERTPHPSIKLVLERDLEYIARAKAAEAGPSNQITE